MASSCCKKDEDVEVMGDYWNLVKVMTQDVETVGQE